MTTEILHVASDCQIISSRVVNAPIEIVFQAWTDPHHLANWWGPTGFTNTFKEFDLRPGGRWRFIMHGPEKGNYANECVFIKIEKPHLIAWYRVSKPIFQVAASFEELAIDRTNVIFKMLFETAEECNKLIKFVPEKNEENFDKLEAELLSMIK